MAQYQLLLPKMGETVAEATVIKWIKNPGDMIQVDESVLEIATDKVDSDVPSPVAGKLVKQLCNVDDVVQVGTAIAIIETDSDQEENQLVKEEEKPVHQLEIEKPSSSTKEQKKETPQGDYKESARFYSPLVKV